jgi:hypothetical protein
MIRFELIRADRILNPILEQRFLSCRQRMKYENDIKSSQTGLLVSSSSNDDLLRVQYAFHGNINRITIRLLFNDLSCSYCVVILYYIYIFFRL